MSTSTPPARAAAPRAGARDGDPTGAPGAPGGAAELPRGLGWALGSGTVLQGLNSSVVAVALVPIALDLGAADSIPWIVSGLYVAAAVGSPTGGRLADLYGARRVYLTGLAIVLVASLAGPFLRDVDALVAVRVIIGLGTSLQFPAAMAIIRRQAALRGAGPVGAIGVVALCGQATAAVGPTVGGLVVAALGWPGIFWANLPVVLNAVLWVWLVVPPDPARPRLGLRPALRRVDPPGALLFVGALVLLMMWLLSLQGRPAWWMLGALVPVVVLLVLRERRAAEPFLDVRMLTSHRQLTATCARAVVTFTSFYCVFYGLPQWLQGARGLGVVTTGLLMLPVFGVGVLSTLLASRLARRTRPRVLLAVGTGAMVLAGVLLVVAVGTDSPLWLVVVANALLGVPNGFNNLGNQLLLHGAVPEAAAGAATGLYRTSQYVGAALSAVVVAHALGAEALDGGVDGISRWITGLGGALFLLNAVGLHRPRRAARRSTAQV